MSVKTVLLVVDVQRSLLARRPYEGAALRLRIVRLITSCRDKGIEVLYVRHNDGPGTDLARETEGWALAAPLAPMPGEPIFDKQFNSSFYQTGLRNYLQENGVRQIILVGMQTEYCIDATCKAAFEHGFTVIIPAGCFTTFDNCWLSGAELNAFYTQIWHSRFAKVLPLETVLDTPEK